MSYTYDGKFEGNILVVERTGCGKTGFAQKLAVNRFFGGYYKGRMGILREIRPAKRSSYSILF